MPRDSFLSLSLRGTRSLLRIAALAGLLAAAACVPRYGTVWLAPETAGRVVLADGSPVPDARVGFRMAPDSAVRTDARGEYLVPAVSERRLTMVLPGVGVTHPALEVRAPGHPPVTVHARLLTQSRSPVAERMPPVVLAPADGLPVLLEGMVSDTADLSPPADCEPEPWRNAVTLWRMARNAAAEVGLERAGRDREAARRIAAAYAHARTAWLPVWPACAGELPYEGRKRATTLERALDEEIDRVLARLPEVVHLPEPEILPADGA